MRIGMASSTAQEGYVYDTDKEVIANTDVLTIVHYKETQQVIYHWRWPQRYMKYDYSYMKLPEIDLKAWKPLSDTIMSHILR